MTESTITQPDLKAWKKSRTGYVIELHGKYLGVSQGSIIFGEIDKAQFFTDAEVAELKTPSAIATAGTELQSVLLHASFKLVQVTTIYTVEK